MRNILVAIDDIEGATVTSALIRQATALARAFAGKLWLLHVVPRPGMTPFTVPGEVLRGQAAAELHHEHKLVQRLSHQLRDSGIDTIALLVEGATVRTILREADRLEADLIVATSHHHSLLYRTLLDGAGERLLNESERPVMFVPERMAGVTAQPRSSESGERPSQAGQ